MSAAALSLHARTSGSPRERGTALLLVIGVLALLAIIAVAYATLGRADRVTSAVSITTQRIDDQSQVFADFLAQIVADDVFSVYPLRTGVSAPADPRDILYVRQAFDYPSTDRQMVSVSTRASTGTNTHRFNPTGTVLGPWTGGVDRRSPSDPYLSSHKPALLGRANSNLPLRPTLTQFAQLSQGWAHISNTSPDGRYVSLHNLRDNFTANATQMQTGLVLINPANGLPYASTAASRTWDNRPPQTWRPADWSTNLLGAFRPMIDQYAPNDFRHIHNQWVDTDGDGYADARWQELVDAFDVNNPVNLLGRSGRYRYFYAARIADLSGLVNVNTATDFAYSPGYLPPALSGGLPPAMRHFPAGLSPSEIDLRRLLVMSDAYFDFGGGYESVPQPTPATLAGNYSQYHQRNAAAIGSAAYAAIRLVIDRGVRLEADDVAGGTGAFAVAMLPNNSRTGFNPNNPNPLELTSRLNFFSSFGVDPGSPVVSGAIGQFAARSPFGLESELSLRAFNGVNDLGSFSSLESTVAGRAGAGLPLSRLDPLRSNRPRTDEMRGRSDSAGTIGPSPEARLLDLVDVRSLITTINGARPLVSRVLTDGQRNSLNAGEVARDLQTLKTVLRRVDGVNVLPINNNPGSVYRAAAESLFGGAISALAPYHDPERFTQSWNPTNALQRTLAYGHRGAELAARLAAHWTANMIAAMDVDTQSTPFAVGADAHNPIAVRVDLVNNLSFSTSNTPFQASDLDLTLTTGYDGFNGNVRSPSFMAYGIEPQPFLVEVSYYVMFTDARDAAEGSTPDEGDPRGGSGIPGDPIPTLEPIKISRKREYQNGDYLGEILAFQLHNPFEYDVRLTGDLGQPLFYLEHARRYYGLTELDSSGSEVVPQSMELKAGQTRVFYVLSPRTHEQMAARFQNALQATVSSDEVKEMMTAQFGDSSVLIPMIDPGLLGSGQVVFSQPAEQGTLAGTNMEMLDFMGESSSGGGVALDGQRSVVNLWRVKRSASNANSRASDMLVDRLRDPDGSAWWYGLVDGLGLSSENVDDTTSIEERTSFDPSTGNDNSGFSVTLWRSVRRPTDRSDVSVVKKGSLPPWCIEAKRDNEYNVSLNQSDESDGGDPSDPIGDRNDFVDEEGSRFTTFRDMINALKSSSGKFNRQMDVRAEDKRGNPIPLSQSVNPSDGQRRPYDRVSMQLHFIGHDLLTIGGQSARIGRNPMLFSRPADMLMIPAIGPSFDLALFQAGGGDARGLELGWMTLGEAAALASDYFSPSPGVYDSTSAIQLLYRLGHENASNGDRPILRRGALVIDDFAPYLNLDGAQGYDGQSDQLLGVGIPAALTLLDQFRTADHFRGQGYGGLNQPVAGTLNINTAPVQNLRLVPLLAPDSNPAELDLDIPWVKMTESIDPNNVGGPIYDPASNSDTFDIASAVEAWRDKIDTLSRAERFNGNRRRIEFAEDTSDAADPSQWRARQDRAQINGLHETPGFRSLGELGTVRIRSTRSNPGVGDPQNSIDRFGLDDEPLQHPGLTVSSWPRVLASPNTTSGPNQTSREADEVVDGVDESLAILNAALPSLSVRSDVFCVWFVLHGYLPGDVTDLDDDEPMVPTIRRRFMMVVDRSNVMTFGDRPRVLLFKEVPLD